MTGKRRPSFFNRVFDYFRDRFTHIMDNTSMRDWLYLLSFFSAVYVAYYTIQKVEAHADFFSFVGMVINYFYPQPSAPQPTLTLDGFALASAIVTAYEALQLNANDITSAIKQLASMGIGAAP